MTHTMQDQAAWPLDVTLHKATGKLEILWSDGYLSHLKGDYLRSACRCAGCEQQRRSGQSMTPSNGVVLSSLHPVGDMGLQLCFNDGHDRGIYPWPYLRELSSMSPKEASRESTV